MATQLKSIRFPGLDEEYTIPQPVALDSTLTSSTAAANDQAVGTKFSQLPIILEGTVEPSAATGTLLSQLNAAPNNSIYIQHS